MNGEQALLEIHRDISSLRSDVTHVMSEGCAKREGDLQEIRNVKESVNELRSWMKGIFYTSLVTCIGIIGFLIKALWPFIIKL